MTNTHETVTVKLTAPIEHEGKVISELTFREAELSDLCASDHFEGEMNKTAAILAGMSFTPLPIIRKIKARDLPLIIEKVGHLMGNEKQSTAGDKRPS